MGLFGRSWGGLGMSSSNAWLTLALKASGVSLIDCDHQTPTAAEEGYPYIAIPQLKNGHISLDGVRRISRDDYLKWTKKLKPQVNDVIVVRRCNSGDSAHVPPGLECAIGQNLIILRADGKTVLPEFLRWLINGPNWWDQVSKYINVGAVFDSLRCRDIPNFELTVPPVEHQREISTVLGALDDRITLLRETNTTLEAIAQALFKSWFVDFDPARAKQEGREPEDIDAATAELFPGSFEESELGLVPKGWQVGSIGRIAEIIDCLHSKKPVLIGDGWPFLQLNNIRDDGLLDSSKVSYITEADYRKWISRIEVAEGDCVITNVGRVGAVAQIPAGVKAAMGRNMTAIRPKNDWPYPTYLIELLQSPWMRTEIKRRTDVGTILDALNVRNIPALRCVLAPRDVMRNFELSCRPLRATMEANLERVNNLAAIRDTLLPRLISGQLRLPDAEALIDEAIA